MPDTTKAAAVQIFEGRVEDIGEADLASLKAAVAALEATSLVARLNAMAGQKLDMAARFIPQRFASIARGASTVAIRAALHAALKSLDRTPVAPNTKSRTRILHKGLAAAAGAAGGAFGIAGLAVELPFSTTLMMRSIADIARHEGEDLADPESIMACLEVFALGTRQHDEAGVEAGYFAIRGALAKSVSEAAKFVLQRRIVDETAPVLLKFVSQIAARFGLVVSQKLAAQAVPVLGALGGAGLNYAFADHFQKLAQGHFTVRRLERRYGQMLVREEYERLAKKL